MSLEDELFEQRAARVREIEALGYRPFGKRFDFTCTVPDVLRLYGEKTAEELNPDVRVTMAGRIMSKSSNFFRRLCLPCRRSGMVWRM